MILTQEANTQDHFKGDLTAPVVVVEYGDYECPLTARALKWSTLLRNDLGKDICFVYRHFPLSDIHPNSALAALASEIAGKHGLFWQMHEKLLEHYNELSCELVLRFGEELNIEEEIFLNELDTKDLIDHVCADMISGENSGVTSTPAFFINNVRLEGPVSLQILRENIMKILGGQRISA